MSKHLSCIRLGRQNPSCLNIESANTSVTKKQILSKLNIFLISQLINPVRKLADDRASGAHRFRFGPIFFFLPMCIVKVSYQIN